MLQLTDHYLSSEIGHSTLVCHLEWPESIWKIKCMFCSVLSDTRWVFKPNPSVQRVCVSTNKLRHVTGQNLTSYTYRLWFYSVVFFIITMKLCRVLRIIVTVNYVYQVCIVRIVRKIYRTFDEHCNKHFLAVNQVSSRREWLYIYSLISIR